jgi:hypothetical protein
VTELAAERYSRTMKVIPGPIAYLQHEATLAVEQLPMAYGSGTDAQSPLMDLKSRSLCGEG